MILSIMAGNTKPAGQMQQTFEKLDKATGGVVGQMADSVKTAASETVQQIAQTPLDILQSLIGGSDSGAESSTSGSDPMAQMQDGTLKPGEMPNNPEFTKKLDEERAKKEALLRQHRTVLQQYEEAFKQKKAQEEQEKQMLEQQEEQIEEQKKVEQKQKTDPRWKQALKQSLGGGKSEVGKNTH